MADKRISILNDYTTLTGMYVALDKPGAVEAVRAPFILVDPRSVYRCNTESVASGEQTITFLTAFPAGTTYAMMTVWGLDADGNRMDAIPYTLTVTGFKINFGVAVTFTYLALIVN
jgi:hypothetical protein